MKHFNNVIAALVLATAACGYTSKNNEMTGQVKKVHNQTPILCSDFVAADISLGVLRNGVGSMSAEDKEVYVPNAADAELLRKAADTGQLVKITYDVARFPAGLCVPTTHVTGVQLLPNAPAPEAK